MTRMRILAIVVCYHPNIEELYHNIQQFIDHVDQLIIWQNSPEIKSEILFLLKGDKIEEKIVFMGNEENKGIAFPLNNAFDMMFQETECFTHLLTMDQDSTWINFEGYKNKISKYQTNAIFSPNVNNEIAGNEDEVKVKTCITSGAVFPKEVLEKIGKFNEEYSVDCVDYDFSFKAYNNGVPIIKITKAILTQTYGIPMVSKFLKIKNHVYSSKRLFFIARNHILLWRDFPQQIDYNFKKMILVGHIFGKLVKVLLLEDSKFSKSKSILQGFMMGILNNRKDKY